jgi:hypothetical protein
MTSSGIETAIFQLVPKCLKQYATAAAIKENSEAK